MGQRKLAYIYGRFCGRTNVLLEEFLVAPPSPPDPPVCIGEVPIDGLLAYSRSFLVNRVFHLWGEFCRSLVVASALGSYRTLNGTVLGHAPKVLCTSDISKVLNLPTLTGPGLRWGDPSWTTRNINKLQLANREQLKIGIGAAPYDVFRRVRNFVIHSNGYTRSEFDSVAIMYSQADVSVDDLLLHKLAGGGTVMEGWIRDFQFAALDAIR